MLLVFYFIFQTSLLLATYSKTDCSSLLRVAVISVAAVADVYKYKHTGFTQCQWQVISKDLKK
jgi:hypothetical protein